MLVSASNHTKSMSFSNQKCITLLIYIRRNTVKNYTNYYPLAFKVDTCVGTCNPLNYLSENVEKVIFGILLHVVVKMANI